MQNPKFQLGDCILAMNKEKGKIQICAMILKKRNILEQNYPNFGTQITPNHSNLAEMSPQLIEFSAH